MSAPLGLVSALVVVVSGYLALGTEERLGQPSHRRDRPFLVLVAPVLGLAAGIVGLILLAIRTCLLGAPPWYDLLDMALPIAMGLVTLGGLALGLIRLALMGRVTTYGIVAPPELQALARRVADRLGIAPPRLLLRPCGRPLAFTTGLFRPTIVLSTWNVDHLDEREIEAVLAHELAHVARGDYLRIWLATVLRDAFFYLPTSWRAYRYLREETEIASDNLAAAATHRPLALASALAKVWQDALVGSPSLAGALHLAEPGVALEGRVRRLMDSAPDSFSQLHHEFGPRSLAVGAVTTVVGLATINALFVLVPIGCSSLIQMVG